MSKFKYKIFVLSLVMFSTVSVFAQDDIPDYDPDIPVDGGVGVLLAAGAAWGIKKLKDTKEN